MKPLPKNNAGTVIAASRLMACDKRPYFTTALISLSFYERPGMGTIGVDKYWRAYYDPEVMIKWGVEQACGVLLHEIGHLLREHHQRAERIDDCDHGLANLCEDAELNDDLVKEPDIKLPDSPVLPSTLKQPDGRLWEEYYANMLANQPPVCPKCGHRHNPAPGQGANSGGAPQPNGASGQSPGASPGNAPSPSNNSGPNGSSAGAAGAPGAPAQGSAGASGQGAPGGAGGCPPCQCSPNGHGPICPGDHPGNPGNGNPGQGRGKHPGQGHCGSAATGKPEGYELPGPDNGGPGLSEIEGELVRKQTAQQIIDHARTRGTIPAGWQRWAEKMIQPAKADWRKVLGAEVRAAVAHAAGQQDYAYDRLSRRHPVGNGRAILPGMIKPEPDIYVIIDSSGSVNEQMLNQAAGEVAAVLRACGKKSGVRVMSCDAQVHTAKRLFNVKALEIGGGGGTDMGVGIAHAAKAKPRPDVIIVLTDGYTPWPTERPGACRMIVGLLDNEAIKSYPPPEWARVVDIDVCH
jgi:predicted metal-dependent peptidase